MAASRDAVLDILSNNDGNTKVRLLDSTEGNDLISYKTENVAPSEDDYIDNRIGVILGKSDADLWVSDTYQDHCTSRCLSKFCGVSYKASLWFNDILASYGILTFAFAIFLTGIIFKAQNPQSQISSNSSSASITKGLAEIRCYPLTGWIKPNCTSCNTELWRLPRCDECKLGHFGPMCDQKCPGSENGMICGGNGWCDDGIHGSGMCHCGFLWRGVFVNDKNYNCEGFNWAFVVLVMLAIFMTPFWFTLGIMSRSRDTRIFDVLWKLGRRLHPEGWLLDCCLCCCLFRDNPRSLKNSLRRRSAFAASPPKYHIFQGMVQGVVLLCMSTVFLAPTHHDTVGNNIAIVALLYLGLAFIVLDLTKRQGYIYGQSVLQLAGTVLKTEVLAKEREADISKLESAYIISEEEITFGTRLSSGGFGEVWQGTFARLPSLPVAIKKIFLTPQNMDIIFEKGIFGDNETKLLMRLNNQRVVKFFGAGILRHGGGQPFLVSEFMEGGDLRELLDSAVPAWKDSLQIATDVAEGMAYLHAVGLLHRDLKSLNVLLDRTKRRAKITDFGASRFTKEVRSRSISQGSQKLVKVPNAQSETKLDSNEVLEAKTGSVGTLAWMAPEIMLQLQGKTMYGLAADVFSFGIVCYELLTRRAPWDNIEPPFSRNIILNVLEGKRPEITEAQGAEISSRQGGDDMLELMRKCWDQTPSKRPSFIQVAARIRRIMPSLQ